MLLMDKQWLEGRKADIEKAYADAGAEIDKLNIKRHELTGAFSFINEALDKLNEVEIIPPKRVKGANNARRK